jgi:hypothetical protein
MCHSAKILHVEFTLDYRAQSGQDPLFSSLPKDLVVKNRVRCSDKAGGLIL